MAENSRLLKKDGREQEGQKKKNGRKGMIALGHADMIGPLLRKKE